MLPSNYIATETVNENLWKGIFYLRKIAYIIWNISNAAAISAEQWFDTIPKIACMDLRPILWLILVLEVNWSSLSTGQ